MNYHEKYFEYRNEDCSVFNKDMRMYKLNGKNKLYVDTIENGKVIFTDVATGQDVYRQIFETLNKGEQLTGRGGTIVKCVSEIKE